MRKSARHVIALLVFGLLGARVAAENSDRPSPVSPGSSDAVSVIDGRCPTFSWRGVPRARGYKVIVYKVAADGRLGEPLVRQSFDGMVFSWTPPMESCLDSGSVYAWTVGARLRKGETSWSDPVLFRPIASSERVSREALAIVHTYLDELEPKQPTVGGSEAAPPSPKQQVTAAPTRPAPSVLGGADFSIDGAGNVEGMSFTGDGSGLTGVTTDFASLTAGTNMTSLQVGSGGSLVATGTGTIAATSVPAGGVTGGGSGSGLDADLLDGNSSAFFQQRVSSTCASGSSIREINADGTVICESDDTGGDNLGNHIATQNLQLNGNYLSGDGGNEGIFISSAGNVGMGGVLVPTEVLDLGGNIHLPEDGQVKFGAGANRIWESGINLNIDAEEGPNSDVQIGASDFIEIEAPNIFIEAEDNDVDITANDDINLQPGLTDQVFVDGDLTVDGDLIILGSCTGCSSDRNLKRRIRPLAGVLDKIDRLRGVSFDWVPGVREAHDMQGRQVGVIAQEVAAVFPELVGTDSRGYRFVRYQKLVAPLIEAVKELRLANHVLTERLVSLEDQLLKERP